MTYLPIYVTFRLLGGKKLSFALLDVSYKIMCGKIDFKIINWSEYLNIWYILLFQNIF